MVRIRSSDELILNALEHFRRTKPDMTLNAASVVRDLFVDCPSIQIARAYDELARIQNAQSLTKSISTDVDKWASNFKEPRKKGTKASGKALLTMSSIDADLAIDAGDLVYANNGTTFTVTVGTTVSVSNKNQYRATASKVRSDLDFVGISDEYAVFVDVQSSTIGTRGNISKYSLSSTGILGITGVTNVAAFQGGYDAETDDAFKNRIMAKFAGASAGTDLGYYQAIMSVPNVLDSVVVGPGNVLMTRDGTQVNIAEDGTRTIIADGTGGKVDIYVQGFRLTEILDSFIYRDKSGKDDPSQSVNDFVLGQIDGDEGKTVAKRRLENLEAGVLPDQPASDIITVTGSLSGSFIAKSVDSIGRISGNYELLKDTGAYAGSVFGFDKLHWIDDHIRDLKEDETKGKFNGQDSLLFSDLSEISEIKQNLSIISENSTVQSDRSYIQLSHTPVTSVTRVFNYTTGERYVVVSQNPDGTGLVNTTGRIKISGNTLPSKSDILQVDYTWIFDYDPYIDFDNRTTNENIRDVIDSIDWGFSNRVDREAQTIQISANQLIVNTTHPITSVESVNTFRSEGLVVGQISGRKAVITLDGYVVANVGSMVRSGDNAEVFNTKAANGTISSYTIYLPTDTIANVGDNVVVTYNLNDVFTVSGVSGSFSGNQITLSTGSATGGESVQCNYIANISTIVPSTTIQNLPALRSGNEFTTLAGTVGTQPTTNVYAGPVIIKNLRKAPSRLKLNVSGTISPGVFTVTGTTFTRIVESVFSCSSASLTQDLSSSIKKAIGLTSAESIPSNVYVSKICKVESVDVNDNFDVLSVINEFDITNYGLNNIDFVIGNALQVSSLSRTQFSMAATADNAINTPTIGSKLRVTFHIAKSSDSENVIFSQSGSQYTQKVFAKVDSVIVSSGFTSGSSKISTLTISNMNQPVSGSRYTAYYDYIAPKQNERITIRYNRNSIITDGTFAIQGVSFVSSDVLVKAAIAISIDADIYIVVASGYENSKELIIQNVKDAVTTFLNSNNLGTTIDESDIINICYTVAGVDRVRISHFNKTGESGRVLSIDAYDNEYLQSGTVNVLTENR